jgi:hypothetical protein
LITGIILTAPLILACAISHSIRSVEFRIPYGYFADVESWRLGLETRGKKVHLVPIPSSSADARRKKRAEIHLVFEPLTRLEKLAALTLRPRINLVLYHGVLAPPAGWRARVVAYGGPAGCCASGRAHVPRCA